MNKNFYYTFIIYRIRQTSCSDIVDISKIKEIVGRVAISKQGLPRFMVRYIIQDLMDNQFIKKINSEKFQIEPMSKLENRIKALMLAY